MNSGPRTPNGRRRLESLTRRAFLEMCPIGLGGIALAALGLREAGAGTPSPAGPPLAPRAPHFTPRARRVIYLHMVGGPPQQDLLDYKPKLNEWNGKTCPEEFTQGERFAFIRGVPKLLGSPFRFKRHGACGQWFSELLPELGGMADELCFVHSLQTDEFNHAPAELLLFTGSPRVGRPSLGSWVTWGLGTENQDLPGYIVLVSSGHFPTAGKALWSSGFLPTVYQGVQCRAAGDPVLFLSNPAGVDREARRAALDAARDLNERQFAAAGDPETRTRIEQHELAFRMQLEAPEAFDLSREPEAVLAEYGAAPGAPSYANNCLLARRLVERGVRFVQLYDYGWDFHGSSQETDIVLTMPDKARAMDRATAALLRDLGRRGLLDDTLVVWGGEFGRTPMNEERNGSRHLGRDHHPHCNSVILAGGGVKRGLVHGATDELGYHVVEGAMHVHDFQATLLHLLGFDHERLTWFHRGRDFRLTDVFGEVQHQLLA